MYDRQNYARQFAYCWASRQQLKNTHPRLYTEFKQGNFSVRRSAGHFNKLPPDQVIEQTSNKDQKGSVGIIGHSTSEGTVQRWILTRHVAARLLGDMENSLGIRGSVSLTKDLGKSKKEFDEKNTKSCYELLKSWTPQFDSNLPISGLSSGVIASDSVQSDLLRANSVGTDCFHKFLKKRVESSKIQFYSPLKKNKLKTFNSEEEKKTHQVDSKNITVTDDRDMFARMLLIREVRKELVSIRELLKYFLEPLPWALATADGGLRKTTKITAAEMSRTVCQISR